MNGESPERGPRALFFSGGTALRATSRALIDRTHNSTHVITPFDSGGSSAVIRQAFAMPAVGDIRNRLMALADLASEGSPEIFALFTYRLSKRDSQEDLISEIRRLANSSHVLIHLIPEKKRMIIVQFLRHFLDSMPDDFDLRGASIGNLVLTAGYLAHGRCLDCVIDLFSELAHVRGLVRPVIEADLHLAAELEDGTVVVGQHNLTGKEVGPLSSKITRLWMTQSLDDATPVSTAVAPAVRDAIHDADLICFPIGSFYTSVVANLLPDGVGAAVAANPCPKVFVPNPLGDPELLGHTVPEQVAVLRRYLVASGSSDDSACLTHMLVDSRAEYPGGLDVSVLSGQGVTVMDTPLLADGSLTEFEPEKLADALVSLAD